MLRIIVRARKDAKAARAAAERLLPGWPIEVVSLAGRRRGLLEAAVEEATSGLNLLLLGEEDAKLDGLPSGVWGATQNLVVVVVPRARVRNARLEVIAEWVRRGVDAFRLTAYWGGSCYSLAPAPPSTGWVEVEVPEWASDLWLGLGRWSELTSNCCSSTIDFNPLIAVGAEAYGIYSAGELAAVLHTPADSEPRCELLREPRGAMVDVRATFEATRGLLSALVEAGRSVVRYAYEAAGGGRVAVPISGGKDSEAALSVTVEALGAEKVVAIHVSTGLDPPWTREVVEEAAARLGVELLTVEAGIGGLVEAGSRRLTRGDRWCTGLKLEALRRAVRSVDARLVVVGDRGGESRRRARRSPASEDWVVEGAVRAAPLLAWGAAHVLLYLLLEARLPVHPLYFTGFHRLGCTLCPYARPWEYARLLEFAGSLLREWERRELQRLAGFGSCRAPHRLQLRPVGGTKLHTTRAAGAAATP